MRVALLLAAAGLAMAAEDAPPWVRQEAARQAPSYPATVSNVVLLHEEQLTVTPEGRWTMRERAVIRILQASHDKLAAVRSYDTKNGRIRDFHAWLLPAGGSVQTFKPQQVVDISLADSGQMYDEARAKILECPNAPPASVFAYEIVEEQKTSFTQYLYSFQDDAPVLISRFLLSLPAGWEMKDTMLNHAPVTAASSGGTYTWELHDLPAIEPEPFAPRFSRLTPRLGVTFYATGGAPPLKDWAALSNWTAGLVQPASAPTAAIRAKAASLATGASTLEKLKAIGAYAQKVNYVGVQLNVTMGGGYTPHNAEQVLTRNYGDCKDKASLMKSLLEAAGIEAYFTLAYSGDRRHVRPEWPSAQQFNHAIVAIHVGPEIDLPAVLDHPRLGRLLFFDPTDPYTQLGDLPDDEQGSSMLVVSGDKGELVTAPQLPAANNRVESAVSGKMDASGALTATLERHYFGESAASMRATAAEPEKDALRHSFEAGFAQRLGGVKIASLESDDKAGEHRFDAKLQFEVQKFGQNQAKLLLFRPGSIVPSVRYSLPARERKLPVELSAAQRVDKIRIELPPGYKVDEMPEPVEWKTAYGVYRATCREAEGALVFEQSLELADIAAPPAEYGRIRDFFNKVAGYQNVTVVLVKQ